MKLKQSDREIKRIEYWDDQGIKFKVPVAMNKFLPPLPLLQASTSSGMKLIMHQQKYLPHGELVLNIAY